MGRRRKRKEKRREKRGEGGERRDEKGGGGGKARGREGEKGELQSQITRKTPVKTAGWGQGRKEARLTRWLGR